MTNKTYTTEVYGENRVFIEDGMYSIKDLEERIRFLKKVRAKNCIFNKEVLLAWEDEERNEK